MPGHIPDPEKQTISHVSGSPDRNEFVLEIVFIVFCRHVGERCEGGENKEEKNNNHDDDDDDET